MPTQKTTLQVSDGTTVDAYVSMPEGKGPFPGLLVLQEAFGVNAHIRTVCDRFAKEGYVAIAPELFHRTAAPGTEIDYTDREKIMPHIQALTTEGLAADMKAAYDWLQKQPNVKRDKIGSVGYCMGGRASFIANTSLPLAAAISYYGGGLAPLAERASMMHGPHLFFWGGLDKHILPEHIDTVINAVQKAGKPYANVVFSYADHGFNCDVRASYHKQASAESWALALAFFKNNLQG